MLKNCFDDRFSQGDFVYIFSPAKSLRKAITLYPSPLAYAPNYSFVFMWQETYELKPIVGVHPIDFRKLIAIMYAVCFSKI